MTKLKYEEPKSYSHDEVSRVLNKGDGQEIAAMLVGVVFNNDDYGFAFKLIANCLNSDDPSVRGSAVLCLGHIARIHGKIEEHPTIDAVLRGLRDSDEWVRGQAENAADDIEVFAPEVGKKIRTATKKA